MELTVACDTRSHFFTGGTVTVGPRNDSPQFDPVLRQTSLVVRWDRVLADVASDSEANHRRAREGLGVRATVIPLNHRKLGRRWPQSRYRRQMIKRFRKKMRGSRYQRVFGQRWRAESAFSRPQRRLGSALGASPSIPGSARDVSAYSLTT